MKDLTQGSVTKHLLSLSIFLAVSMLFQTLYYLADLYWVGRLGKEAIAAVALAGNIVFLVFALTQTLSVGTTALIAQASGRKDMAQVNLLFNQSMVMSVAVGMVTFVVAFFTRAQYCRFFAADLETAAMGVSYLTWFLPAMGIQFLMVSVSSALRGTGIVKPAMIAQVATVILNIALAPVLIFGWGTKHPMGVAGAALATLISIVVGVIAMVIYVVRGYASFRFTQSQWRAKFSLWWSMAKVGLPAGAEFMLIALYFMIVYWIIRGFGAAAQAGFGIGARIMQSMFLPVMSIAFAVAPVAGQNFGARKASRVRQTFYSAASISAVLMFTLTLVCQFWGPGLIHLFSKDAGVIAFGTEYLRIISWNFVAAGLAFTASSMFQGMGNTLPSLASSASRLVIFALPAMALSVRPDFHIRQVWYLSLASVFVQAGLACLLLRREFKRRLVFGDAAAAPVQVGAVSMEA